MRLAGSGTRHHGLHCLYPCIMKSMRTFKPYDLDQPYLLPPNLRDWLPEGHLALFVSDVIGGWRLETGDWRAVGAAAWPRRLVET